MSILCNKMKFSHIIAAEWDYRVDTEQNFNVWCAAETELFGDLLSSPS